MLNQKLAVSESWSSHYPNQVNNKPLNLYPKSDKSAEISNFPETSKNHNHIILKLSSNKFSFESWYYWTDPMPLDHHNSKMSAYLNSYSFPCNYVKISFQHL